MYVSPSMSWFGNIYSKSLPILGIFRGLPCWLDWFLPLLIYIYEKSFHFWNVHLLLMEFGWLEVTLHGWQDVKIQLLLQLRVKRREAMTIWTRCDNGWNLFTCRNLLGVCWREGGGGGGGSQNWNLSWKFVENYWFSFKAEYWKATLVTKIWSEWLLMF